MIAKNNNFPLNKFRVYIKYPETKEMECKNWVWRNLSFNIDGKQKHLNIKSDEYLAIRSLLPKDEVVLGYVSFSSLNDRDIRFEYVKYVFEDFQGKTKTLIFPSESIDENTQLFDDSIWSE